MKRCFFLFALMLSAGCKEMPSGSNAQQYPSPSFAPAETTAAAPDPVGAKDEPAAAPRTIEPPPALQIFKGSSGNRVGNWIMNPATKPIFRAV